MSRSDKWTRVSRILEIGTFAMALIGLLIAWFAFKVPLDESNQMREMEQATKIAVSLNETQDNGEYKWHSKVINSSDAPIFNVQVRVTPETYSHELAATASYKSEYTEQILPGDSVVVAGGSSSYEGKSLNIVQYKVKYTFEDANGKKWYKAYKVDKEKTGEDELMTDVTVSLTSEKPDDWDMSRDE